MKGVIFEKDASGENRYVRFDLKQHGEKLRPILKEIEEENTLEGWEETLSPEEFLEEAKRMLRRKFNERDKVR